MQKLLRFEANKRISARQALRHHYFQEYELYPPKYDNALNTGLNKKFSSANDDNSSHISR